MEFDIAIIGGGIVGAATFYLLQKKNPTLKIALFEKENILAKHQTGHNSGVLHSGLYYKPGSLKAKNCIEGKREMIAFAKEYGIAHDICGKVVVASNQQEIVRLEKIHQIGIENKIEGIERISSDQVKEIEPFVECLSGLWVPSTGIIDFASATKKMIELALALKFLSNVDLSYHLGILNRDVFLVLWIVVFFLLGVYLLGKLKFAHDSDLSFVSVPRLFFAIASFSFAVYMVPGLWGAPLKALSGFIPPSTTQEFNLNDLQYKIGKEQVLLLPLHGVN
jgi:hypothetical protein